MGIVYIDKCRYEIQEQREVPVWHYRHISAHFDHCLQPNEI
jgi:hypothetical protein